MQDMGQTDAPACDRHSRGNSDAMPSFGHSSGLPVWNHGSIPFFDRIGRESYRRNDDRRKSDNISESGRHLEEGEIYDDSEDAMRKKFIPSNRMVTLSFISVSLAKLFSPS